jgi:tetratricopeptide (TPR) repeat protein
MLNQKMLIHQYNGGFVWDDNYFLLNNKVYESFDLLGILTGQASKIEYFPVRDFFLALDYAIWEWNPIGFHLSNIIFFFLNATFVYFTAVELVKLLLAKSHNKYKLMVIGVPFLTTLLWVSHPLNTEAVSFVICKAILLTGLFFFISIYSFLVFMRQLNESSSIFAEVKKDPHQTTPKSIFFSNPVLLYFISIIAFIFSIFSKQYSIMLPGILLLFVLVNGKKLIKHIIYLLPFLGITAGAFYIFKDVASKSGTIFAYKSNALTSDFFINKILVAAQIPFFYIKKIFVPVNFSVEYTQHFFSELKDPIALFSLIAIVLFALVVILLRKRYPVYFLSLGFYFIALIPVLHFFATSTIVTDRYAFIPSFGIMFLLAFLFFRYVYRGSFKKGSIVIMALIIVSLAFSSFQRSRVWKSEETLWLNTISVSPTAPKAYFNIATYYFNSGEHEKAIEILKKQKELTGSDILLNAFNGVWLFEKNDYVGAIREFEKITNYSACPINAVFMFAQAYDKTKNTKKAMEFYSETVKSNFQDGKGYKKMAEKRIVELQTFSSAEISVLRKRVQEYPTDLKSYAKLASLLEDNLMYNEAILTYEKIISISGDYWAVYYNLATIYSKVEEYDKAVENFRKSISLNNKYPFSYNNLGLILKEMKDYEGAIEATKTAMNLDPNFKDAALNLAIIYFEKGDQVNALKYFNYVLSNFPELEGKVAIYMNKLNNKR